MASCANSIAVNTRCTSREPASPAADAKLAPLVTQHADLDFAISVLLQACNYDDLIITRLKKQKLRLKEEIFCCTRALFGDRTFQQSASDIA